MPFKFTNSIHFHLSMKPLSCFSYGEDDFYTFSLLESLDASYTIK